MRCENHKFTEWEKLLESPDYPRQFRSCRICGHLQHRYSDITLRDLELDGFEDNEINF